MNGRPAAREKRFRYRSIDGERRFCHCLNLMLVHVVSVCAGDLLILVVGLSILVTKAGT